MAAAAAITGKLTDVRNIASGAGLTGDDVPKRVDKDFLTNQSIIPPKARVDQAKSSSGSGGMPTFTTLKGKAAAIDLQNIDTDMIIPKQFLKTIKRTGLGVGAFYEMRFNADGSEKPDFVLNKPKWRGSPILVAGDNFWCGSSREHAPWAINYLGIRCIISTSFADIFFNNCFNNSMLPIMLDEKTVRTLMQDANDNKELEIDLKAQTITRADGSKILFDVDAFRKHCLLNGLDDVGLTMLKDEQIAKFEIERSSKYPWLDGARQSAAAAAVSR